MIEIAESGVIFGPFEEGSVFQIEKSEHLPTHVKPVEFAFVSPKNSALVLVEAKSSFSRPENKTDFDKNIQEIYQKLVDSLTVLISTKVGRHDEISNELPVLIRELEWGSLPIYLRLVIPTFQDSWLVPITDALRIRLKHFLASLGVSELNFQVLNQRLATQQGLLVQ